MIVIIVSVFTIVISVVRGHPPGFSEDYTEG